MTHGDGTVVTLPGGVLDGDRRYDTAALRSVTGHEEELLAVWADVAGLSLAAQVTALLTCCVERLGADRPTADDLRHLTVGDREALLLHLRRITVGERLDCTLSCPDPACSELVDLSVAVTDLLVPRYDGPAMWHEESFPAGDATVRLRFRLPTGADQEAVAALAETDPEAAARQVFERCLEAPGLAPLGAETLAAVSDRMAELDPQGELRLTFGCPGCGTAVDSLFDTGTFLLTEVAAAGARLAEEVHALAWYYHWSEAEILGMTARRRRRYLDLIAAELDRAGARGAA
jgi:hypothetical protein